MNVTPEQYREHAVLLREIASDMLQRMQHLINLPTCILDLGSGADVFTSTLKAHFENAHCVGVDENPAFIDYANHHSSHIEWHCASYQSLPFPDESFDFIFANLLLSICHSPSQVLAEAHRVLKPDGIIFASVLGDQTRVGEMPLGGSAVFRVSEVADAFVNMNFIEPVLEMDTITLRYPDSRSLSEELQALGILTHSSPVFQASEWNVDVILLHAFKPKHHLTHDASQYVAAIPLHVLKSELSSRK